MYDHSVRVPLMVMGPGVTANDGVMRRFIFKMFMATSLELASAVRPEHLYFHSLLPLLNGQRKESFFPSVYGAYLDLQRSITHEGWKLIAYPRARVVRLYDLRQDPMKMRDLASDPSQAERKLDLIKKLRGLQASLGDKLDMTDALPNFSRNGMDKARRTDGGDSAIAKISLRVLP